MHAAAKANRMFYRHNILPSLKKKLFDFLLVSIYFYHPLPPPSSLELTYGAHTTHHVYSSRFDIELYPKCILQPESAP